MGRFAPDVAKANLDTTIPNAKVPSQKVRDERRKAFLRHVLAVRHQEKKGGLGEQVLKQRLPKAAKLYGAGEAHVSDILYFLTLCDVSETPCTMGDVNAGAAVPRSSAHRLITQLVVDGVVRKEQSKLDRRFSTLKLSNSFRTLLLKRIDAIMAETGFLLLTDPKNSDLASQLSDGPITDNENTGRAEYVDREIRDALNIISGFAELLLDPVMGLTDMSPHRSHVEAIHRAAMRLNVDREDILQNLQADRVPPYVFDFLKQNDRC